MQIRDERADDVDAIRTLVADAFRTMPFGHQTEHFIVDALRRAGALTISLVAEDGGEVTGHVALSPVTVGGQDAGWYGLGPIAVAPGRQQAGIGSALVRAGLDRLRALGAGGCILVGDPGYYRRFGFRSDPRISYPGVPAHNFMILPLDGAVPEGEAAFHPAFAATG